MTVEKALVELLEAGFEITQVANNEFVVTDNGMFGFLNEEDPFTVDGEDLLEIHEKYLC